LNRAAPTANVTVRVFDVPVTIRDLFSLRVQLMPTLTVCRVALLGSLLVAPAAAQVPEAVQKKFGDAVDMRFDVPYAGTENPKQTINLFLPKQPNGDQPLPIIVHIHGGGWSGGDKAGYTSRCVALAATGDYAAASVGYRLSGEVKWPAQIYDCKAALRWLHAHAKELNIDPERIGVTGSSAGGHLVTLLGVTNGNKKLEGDLGENTSASSRVACVINFCGPQDMGAPLMQGEAAKTDDPAVAGLVGGPLAEHAEAVKECSPLTYVSKKAVPIMTVHGTNDARVDYKHAEWLDAAMKKAGATSYLVPMQGAGHGIPIGPELEARMLSFWDHYLRGKATDISTAPIDVSVPVKK